MSSAAPTPRRGRQGWGWWSGFRALPGPLRATAYVAVAVVLLLVVGLFAAGHLVRRTFPETTGTVDVPGLSAPVEVLRDEQGIPQIYADTTEDLMAAQGYVAAQDRFYEMDVRRHATAGRLAELFGPDALESDLYVRTMGWRRVAERELPLLDPGTRRALAAYARGVNAYLDGRSAGSISLEYAVLDAGGLDYTPEEWTEVDSLAWLKAMAWDLRGNMTDEVDRALTTAAVGAERAAELHPAYPYDEHAPIVAGGAVVDGVFDADASPAAATRRAAALDPTATDALGRVSEGLERMPAWLGRGDGIGSNSWVVSGERTASGSPLLANDPHLGTSLPGVWLQVGLHCRTVGTACPYDVSGFSFSGVPGVIIGHNADVAWGFTNLGPDVTDLYVERIRGEDQVRAGRRVPLRMREERFEVEGGADVTTTVRSTTHGPILSDVDDVLADVADVADVPRPTAPEGEDEEYAVSLAWTALTPSTTADAILGFDRASDWGEFRAAARDFAVPAQNLVYADVEGHIGYQAPGAVPLRRSGNDGRSPAIGWRPDNDWTGGYVPFQALPSVLDPEEGVVVTANQAVVGPDYPFRLTDDWDRGYRSERIRDLLGDRTDLTTRDLLDVQLDTANPMAPVLVPRLLDVAMPAGYYADGQQLLADWDLTQPASGPGESADGAAAAYYNVVWRRLLALTFHDELPEAAWPDGGQRWMAVVTDLLDDPGSAWWDDVRTERVETRDDVLATAMRGARDELTSRQSPVAADWSWGRLHRLELRSQTLGESGIGAVEALFNRGGWDVGGGGSIIDATSWDAREGYGVVAAPSMRMVVDLADLDASRWVNLTGVSGHAFDDHYTDQTELWVRGETLGWPFSRRAVEAATRDRLVLR